MAQPTAVAATFRTPVQAAVFSVAVILLLALPAIFSALGLYGRRAAYLEMSIGNGGYVFTAKEVLDERSDLDMVLMGDSTLWLGVDTAHIQEELARAEGHPVRVRTFGHSWLGLDLDYATLRDALARRRVKTLVIAVPRPDDRQDRPHAYARQFLPYGEDPAMASGLSLQQRMTLYGESVLGAPRHLVSLLRRDPDFVHPAEAMLGAHLVDFGYEGAPYRPIHEDPPTLPVESVIYSPASASRFAFAFTGTPLTDYQAHFAGLIADLVRAHGIRLIVFHVPRWSDRAAPVVVERFDWTRVFGVETTLVGVAPAVLFRGMTDDEITSLYGNEHFNTAGAQFFTRAITPALLEIHRRGR